jgi:curved DNA-binding protein CbpA
MDIDPYEILGVKNTATPQEVKKAYKNLAMKLHPDKIGNNLKALDQMKLVNEAYAILKNKSIRESFDVAGDWEKEASTKEREKVWHEYSKQVEEYYEQVRSYLEKKLKEMEIEREKLSSIEIELRKRETEFQKTQHELEKREKSLENHVKIINQFGGREKELVDKEKFISRREKEMDDLLLHISKAYALVVELGQASKDLKKK